jgi:hypothetical protein
MGLVDGFIVIIVVRVDVGVSVEFVVRLIVGVAVGLHVLEFWWECVW